MQQQYDPPELYKKVVLTCDFPDKGLRKGDMAYYVDYLEPQNGVGPGAILELFSSHPEGPGVATVPYSAIAAPDNSD